MTWPFGVAVDNNDHVYVSDDWRNTIFAFDSSGNFLRKWGTTGSGDGELMRPGREKRQPSADLQEGSRLQRFPSEPLSLQSESGKDPRTIPAFLGPPPSLGGGLMQPPTAVTVSLSLRTVRVSGELLLIRNTERTIIVLKSP